MRSPAATFERRALAFTCCLAMFLYAVYLAAIGVLLPAIGETFKLGPAAQGRLFPANFTGFIVVVLIAGRASDRIDRKIVLMLGLGLFALGLLLFSLAPTFDLALAATLLIGGGSGAVGVTSSALAADLYAHRQAHMISIIQVAFGLGASVGPGTAYLMLHHHVSWRLLYAVVACASVAILLLLQAQKPPRRTIVSEAVPTPSLRSLLAQRPMQWLCLFQVFYAGGEVGFFSWMPTYFEKELPGGAYLAGGVITVFWIAMTLGRIITGKFIGRMPLMRLSALLAAGGVVCSTLTLVSHTPLVVLSFVVLTGLCFSGIFVLMSAEAANRYTSTLGAVFGCLVATGGVGTALIPWAVSAVAATRAGWTGGLALIPCAIAGVMICSLLLDKQDHRKAESQ